MQIQIEGTRLLRENIEAATRVVVNQGGTRSGKTYSIAQAIILKHLNKRHEVCTIVRKTLPSLRSTAMRDFFEILTAMGLYDEQRHDKTNNTYLLGSNLIEFTSMDQPQKKRGAKRQTLWINEANELTLEDWRQLMMRTEGQVFIDYNPDAEFHWIYDHVLTREDVTFIHSTYKDNPFLPKSIIDEIEALKDADPQYWAVFGLGERGTSRDTIFLFQTVREMPQAGVIAYGLDFGYNNPSALVRARLYDNSIYAEEVIYQSRLTTPELIDSMKAQGVPFDAQIYCDAARPDQIDEIYRAGFKLAKPANKDVGTGIDSIKRRRLFVTQASQNLINELRGYKWAVDKNGKTQDIPVKLNDHAVDALRYAIHSVGNAVAAFGFADD